MERLGGFSGPSKDAMKEDDVSFVGYSTIIMLIEHVCERSKLVFRQHYEHRQGFAHPVNYYQSTIP